MTQEYSGFTIPALTDSADAEKAFKDYTDDVVTALALKAPLASPTFTGTPSLPTGTTAVTQTQADNSTKLATTAYTDTGLATKAPTASPTFTGVVAVPLGSASAPSIVPTGDTNTGIYSPGADQVGIATAGTAALYVSSTQQVGIGTTAPGVALDVFSAAASTIRMMSDSGATLQARTASDTPATVPNVTLSKSRGTNASRTAVAADDWLGAVNFAGWDGSAYRNGAQISSEVDGTPAASDMPGRLRFSTVPDGSITLTERMRIDNAGLITGTGTSLGAWTSYTPSGSGTGWSYGTSTFAGQYCRIGKIVHFQIKVTWAGVTIGTGLPQLSLPVTADDTTVTAANLPVANAFLIDTSTGGRYVGAAFLASTTTVAVGYLNGSLVSAPTTTVPFTWADGDLFVLSGTYEAA